MAGLFDTLFPQQGMSEEEQKKALRDRAILGFGLGMMKAAQGGQPMQQTPTFVDSLIGGFEGGTAQGQAFQEQMDKLSETEARKRLAQIQEQEKQMAMEAQKRQQEWLNSQPEETQQEVMRRSVLGEEAQYPSSVREYQYFVNLSPEEQQRYMALRRNPQIMNLGGEQVVYSPLSGGVVDRFEVTPKPEQMPEFKAEQAKQIVSGKAMGEAEASLSSQQAKLDNLDNVVKDLSKLGEKASYSKISIAKDITRRELGMEPTEGSIARQEYISMVDNQILPLLRDTFGAQFTEREGQTLRATLGNPNLSPKEKDAVLKAFIKQKKANIEDLKKQLSKGGTTSNRRRFNPSTGSFE